MEKNNCLIVDDDPLMGWMLEMLMSERKFSATKVYTGKKALEFIHSMPYDLVFLDINLPDANGLDILEEIRKTDTAAYVVIMTADLSYENKQKAREGQASYFLEKPFGIREVKAVIDGFLAKKRSTFGKPMSKKTFQLQQRQDRDSGKVRPLRGITDGSGEETSAYRG
jgi:DNA-binding response OmpR family regulator